MTRLVTEVDDLTVQEIVSISMLFDVDHDKISHIVFKQYLKDRKIK
jgi:hypothetical protein